MNLRFALWLLALIPLTASATSIESLVMPGPVIEGHADVEQECSSCHAPFSQATQRGLCLECHEDISADLAAKHGFHGTDGRLEETACRDCHTEHEGRDADIVGLVPEAFDHTLTGFVLDGGHSTLSCADCHAADSPFRDAEPACRSCHEADDPHRGNLGDDCAACHAPSAWDDVGFDHTAETDFALLGGHDGLACEACHIGQVYEDTPAECANCHALDDVHHGERGSACGDCHSEERWQETQFDHAAETGFALHGSHADLTCAACHLDNMALAQPPQACAGCHSADDVHQGQRGDQCGDCHGERTWEVEFDHLDRTGFALRGAHAALACNQCHLGSLSDELPTDCAQCHQADDPHAGDLTDCAACHGVSEWRSPIRFDHDFARFPLLGMHKLAVCEQCHFTLEFQAAPDACDDCHGDDDVHDGSLGPACDDCHVPSGWALWEFDHDNQTDFPLTGAHTDLVCAACHEPGDPDALDVAQACASCHQTDDVHNGQFGSRCERCHNTDSFQDDAGFF
ncbi:MAG: hypothetical protein RIC56_02305 [Pseudomonadales bacterium]